MHSFRNTRIDIIFQRRTSIRGKRAGLIHTDMSFFKNLFGHNEAQNAHNQVYGGNQDYSSDYQQPNQGSFTHEAIAGAAGFEGKYNFSFSH